jgi:hypothetical protein
MVLQGADAVAVSVVLFAGGEDGLKASGGDVFGECTAIDGDITA